MNRRHWLQVLSGVCLMPAGAAFAAFESPQTLWLQPLGRVPDWQRTIVREALAEQFGFTVRELSVQGLPRAANYQPRARHRAEKLLNFLEGVKLPTGPASATILGMTGQDISTSARGHRDWGIFGLGRLPGRSAVMSSFRLRPKGRSMTASQRERLWRHRLGILAVHEIGHTLGLPHCDEHSVHCPMRDADASIAIADDSVLRLGPYCRGQLQRLGWSAAGRPPG